MLTKHQTLVYQDFIDIHNAEITLTPENACSVFFSNDSLFRANTINIMEQFLADEKTYMVFNFGLCDDNPLYLVAKYLPEKYASNSAPSISLIKDTAMQGPSFDVNSDGKRTVRVPDERLRPLLQTVVDSLPKSSANGLYTIRSAAPPLIKAQLEQDRSGFRKIWINGTLHDEKNYGECSLTFSVVGIYLK